MKQQVVFLIETVLDISRVALAFSFLIESLSLEDDYILEKDFCCQTVLQIFFK